jgi:hypothetical protein
MTMTGTFVRSHLPFVGAVLLLTAVHTSASQAPRPEGPPEPPARSQTFMFEMVLRSAIDLGGQKLAQAAAKVVPHVTLTPAESPIVRGVRLTGYGYHFDVQVPDIMRQVLVFEMLMESNVVRGGTVSRGGVQTVATGPNRAAATAVAVDDPMVDSPAAFNPTTVYSTFVREALIDALLDSSGVLSLGPDDHLAISVSGIEPRNQNPLYPSSRLVLTIKAADLLEFRQGRITREDVRARILEERN